MQRNGLLLLVLAGALALSLWVLSRDKPSTNPANDPIGQNHPPSSPLAGGTQADPVLEEGDPEERLPSLAPDPAAPSAAPSTRRLQMVAAADRAPLPGIRAYVGADVLAGPSSPDGWLEFVPPMGRRTTFWAEGYVPQEFRTRQLPAEQVLLSRADASLEVQLDALDPDEGALRCLLEPLDWTSTAQVAWAETLEVLSPSRLEGRYLAPGRYQLYVWIGAFGAAGVPLEPVPVVLVSGRHELVRLDASVKPDEEVDR